VSGKVLSHRILGCYAKRNPSHTDWLCLVTPDNGLSEHPASIQHGALAVGVSDFGSPAQLSLEITQAQLLSDCNDTEHLEEVWSTANPQSHESGLQ
jgi:hypothetical protein